MYEDGSINFDELGRIVEDQIARGTDAIVICGTTGECSTMTDEEQLAAIKYTVDLVSHRVPVIAGAGSNDTDHGCALAAKSAACGADALLLVTPYYNKTSQAGLVAHFTAMAEAGGLPVILYNVPSRTGLNIAPETAKELSKHPLINGIKEASGNIGQVAKIAALCGDELNIYSGNDDQVVPLLVSADCPSWSPATHTRSRSSRLCRLQVLSRNKRFYVQMPGETGLRAFAV